jgi:hypothetical protein
MTTRLATPQALPLRRVERGLFTYKRADLDWILAILAAIIFEGAVRKWLAPPALHSLVFGLKDVLACVFIFRHPLPDRIPFLSNVRG